MPLVTSEPMVRGVPGSLVCRVTCETRRPPEPEQSVPTRLSVARIVRSHLALTVDKEAGGACNPAHVGLPHT